MTGTTSAIMNGLVTGGFVYLAACGLLPEVFFGPGANKRKGGAMMARMSLLLILTTQA